MTFERTGAIALLLSLVCIRCGGEQKPAETPDNSEQMPPAQPPAASPDVSGGSEPNSNPMPSGGAMPNGGATPNGGAAAPSGSARAPVAVAPAALSDAQIAEVTDAANSAEIAQGKLAQTKSKNADVKRFAAMMISHHTEAKKKQDQLKIPVAESPLATDLEAQAANTLAALTKETGKDFDKTYVDAQVEAHRKVLGAINDRLLPAVQSADLKAYLTEIKTKVEEHLKKAETLQQGMMTQTTQDNSATKHSG